MSSAPTSQADAPERPTVKKINTNPVAVDPETYEPLAPDLPDETGVLTAEPVADPDSDSEVGPTPGAVDTAEPPAPDEIDPPGIVIPDPVEITAVEPEAAVPAAIEVPPRDANHPGRPHWQGLDGLRAIAVAAVAIWHFMPAALQGGFLGVDIFFVISGYLITRLITREFVANGRLSLPNFYKRRARRLLPALTIVLSTVAVAALIWPDALSTIRGGIVSTAIFGANWWLIFAHHPYFVASGRPSPLQHMWSLGVEEQFYLFWPLITVAALTVFGRFTLRRAADTTRALRRVCVLAVAIALASTGLMWWYADTHNLPYATPNILSTPYYATDAHCMGLLLGAALGALTVTQVGTFSWLASRRWLQLASDAAGVAALGVVIWIMVSYGFYWYWLFRGGFLVVAACMTVVIAAATQPTSLLGRALDTPVLRWIGVRSYSIYLWHWPVAVFTRPGVDNSLPSWLDQIVRILITLALSDLTYRFIESPTRRAGVRRSLAALFRTIRDRWRDWPPSPSAVFGGGMCLVVLAALGVLIVHPSAPPLPQAVTTGPNCHHCSIGHAPTHHPGATKHHRGKGHHHPVTPASQPLPRISGYGDSVLLGARDALGSIFPGGQIDAVEGRQAGGILADMRHDAKLGKLHPLVILHTGDNGIIEPSFFESTLKRVESDPTVKVVLVFTDHIDQAEHPWQDPNNALIERVVPRYPKMRIVPWDAIAGQHPSWLYSDEIHLTPQGATGYAKLIKAEYLAAIKAGQ